MSKAPKTPKKLPDISKLRLEDSDSSRKATSKRSKIAGTRKPHRGCRCIDHYPSEDKNASKLPRPPTYPNLSRHLNPNEANRKCRLMGCEEVVTEIGFRLNLNATLPHTNNISLNNPEVLHAINTCMKSDMDFGTVYAFFLATARAEELDICTVAMNCFQRAKFLGIEVSKPRFKWDGSVNLFLYMEDDLKDAETDFRQKGKLDKAMAQVQERYRQATGYSLYEEDQNPREIFEIETNVKPIANPYDIVPRRMWDLSSNRVIPTQLIQAASKGCEWCDCKFKNPAAENDTIAEDGAEGTDEDNETDEETDEEKESDKEEESNEGEKEGVWENPANQIIDDFRAVSHAWLDDMNFEFTPVNGNLWKVPFPRGPPSKTIDEGLNKVAEEIKLLISGELLNPNNVPSFYCWVDVLCLRQEYPDEAKVEKMVRLKEHMVDVATIGNIYRHALGTIRYFNGLGVMFSARGWDSERHWLKRAWTLQEIKDHEHTLNGGCADEIYHWKDRPEKEEANFYSPLNTTGIGKWNSAQRLTLRELLEPVERLALQALEKERGCSIIEVLAQMQRRYATGATDKISGMSYLLRSPTLPVYEKDLKDETAWARCVKLLRRTVQFELLFNFPFCQDSPRIGAGGKLTRIRSDNPDAVGRENIGLRRRGWAPTWKQAMGFPRIRHPCAIPPSDIGQDTDDEYPWAVTLREIYSVLTLHECCILEHCQLRPVRVEGHTDNYVLIASWHKEFRKPTVRKYRPVKFDSQPIKTIRVVRVKDTRGTGTGSLYVPQQEEVGFHACHEPNPYIGAPIEAGKYTLVTCNDPTTGSGWAVCRQLEKAPGFLKLGAVKSKLSPDGLWMQKIGVLRSDNISRLVKCKEYKTNQLCYFI